MDFGMVHFGFCLVYLLSKYYFVLLINIFSALATGGAVVASQFIGQGSIKKAQYSAKQLILITALLASVLMIIIIIFNSSLLQLIFGHVEVNVMKNAEIYFLFSAISYPFIALYNTDIFGGLYIYG